MNRHEFDRLRCEARELPMKEQLELLLKIECEERQIKELRHKWAMLAVAVLAAIATSVGVGVQVANSNRLRQHEIAKRFHEQQFDAYKKVCLRAMALVENIATQEEVSEFYGLVDGDLMMSADPLVLQSAYRFCGDLYNDLSARQKEGVPASREHTIQLVLNKRDSVFQLATACRLALRQAFPDVQLGQLDYQTWEQKILPIRLQLPKPRDPSP